MSKGRKWFYICMPLVFIAGVLTGGFATLRFGDHLFKSGRHGDKGRSEHGVFSDKKAQGEFINKLSKDLSMTETQKTQLKKILDDNDAEFLQIRKEMKGRFEQFKGKIDSQIMTILDDSQKEKFKKMSKEREEHERH
jgi:hypothetical protein